MQEWDFIIDDEPHHGFENMAIDEALLDLHILDDTLPILRIYKWIKPTLSIGRNQKQDEINFEKCKELGIDFVRRPTGGKAVLHDGEITYSFVASKKYGFSEKILESYMQISKALVSGLKDLNENLDLSLGKIKTKEYMKNSLCFAASTIADINYLGLKIVGSAQLRRELSLLQHGSILINQDFSKLPIILNGCNRKSSQVNLVDILGYIPEYENTKNCIIKGFETTFDVKLKKRYITDKEKDLAKSYFSKYKL